MIAPQLKAGDRVRHGQRKGTFICGNAAIATVDFDGIGLRAWIPLDELKRIREKKAV